MQRELSTFPLAPNYLHKLSSAGYITADDLKDVSPTELSEGKFYNFVQASVDQRADNFNFNSLSRALNFSQLIHFVSWIATYPLD